MNSEQTYEIEVTTTVDLSINFEEVYKIVSEECKTNDAWVIKVEFEDCVEYYLKKLYGDKLTNVTLEEGICNIIADDFETYVEEHYDH